MLPMSRALVLLLALILCCCISGSSVFVVAQVPVQDRQEPAGSALRPAVTRTVCRCVHRASANDGCGIRHSSERWQCLRRGTLTLLAGGVLEQDLYSLGGEALVLVYPKKENKVTSVVGQGWAPSAVNVDWYRSRNKTLDGEGLDPAVVPGAVHAALTVLEKWGTMSLRKLPRPQSNMRKKVSRCARAPLKPFAINLNCLNVGLTTGSTR